MPFMAPDIRDFVATLNPNHYDIETSAWSKTGYVNVIMVKGKYQARLQVKGDGRGGVRKRGQYLLPGLFDTALEAATYLAFVKTQDKEWEHGIPPKQVADRKARSKKAPPAIPTTPVPQPLGAPLPTTMATSINIPMVNTPIVAAMPMTPLSTIGYFPPAYSF